jgi:FkbM family methyltransferase
MLKQIKSIGNTLTEKLSQDYEHNYLSRIFYPWLLRSRAIVGTALYKSPWCPVPTSPTRWIASLLPPGAVFIDGGGHAGLMSMVASVCVGNQGEVHTFEPQSALVKQLSRDIAAGKFFNIILNQQLLAEQSGTLVFFQLPDATPSSSLSPLLSLRSDVVKVECPATSLDDYWNSLEKPRPVDLIKLDVEGYEFPVIKGTKNLIQRYHPLLIVEVAYSDTWPDSFGYSLKDMLLFLSELGYKFYISEDYKFLPVVDTSDAAKSENLLCVHE